MGDSAVEYYLGRAAFVHADSGESAVFTNERGFARHIFEVRCRWTAGAGGNMVIKTRPLSGVTGADVTVHTFNQVDGSASRVVETLCEDILATFTSGGASTATVDVIACPLYPAARGGKTFSTVTPA